MTTAIDPDKDQRRHERAGVPVITVTVDGALYEAVNWSFVGFLCMVQNSSGVNLWANILAFL